MPYSAYNHHLQTPPEYYSQCEHCGQHTQKSTQSAFNHINHHQSYSGYSSLVAQNIPVQPSTSLTQHSSYLENNHNNSINGAGSAVGQINDSPYATRNGASNGVPAMTAFKGAYMQYPFKLQQHPANSQPQAQTHSSHQRSQSVHHVQPHHINTNNVNSHHHHQRSQSHSYTQALPLPTSFTNNYASSQYSYSNQFQNQSAYQATSNTRDLSNTYCNNPIGSYNGENTSFYFPSGSVNQQHHSQSSYNMSLNMNNNNSLTTTNNNNVNGIPNYNPEHTASSTGGVSASLDYDLSLMSEFISARALSIMGRRLDSLQNHKLENAHYFLDSFKQFTFRVLRATRLPKSTLILALVYLKERWSKGHIPEISQSMLPYENNGIIPSNDSNYSNDNIPSVYKMLAVSLVLANKFNDDHTFTNKSWSQATGIPVNDLNLVESDWLRAVYWNLHLDDHKSWNEWNQVYESWALEASNSANSVSQNANNMPTMPTMPASLPHISSHINSSLPNNISGAAGLYRTPASRGSYPLSPLSTPGLVPTSQQSQPTTSNISTPPNQLNQPVSSLQPIHSATSNSSNNSLQSRYYNSSILNSININNSNAHASNTNSYLNTSSSFQAPSYIPYHEWCLARDSAHQTSAKGEPVVSAANDEYMNMNYKGQNSIGNITSINNVSSNNNVTCFNGNDYFNGSSDFHGLNTGRLSNSEVLGNMGNVGNNMGSNASTNYASSSFRSFGSSSIGSTISTGNANGGPSSRSSSVSTLATPDSIYNNRQLGAGATLATLATAAATATVMVVGNDDDDDRPYVPSQRLNYSTNLALKQSFDKNFELSHGKTIGQVFEEDTKIQSRNSIPIQSQFQSQSQNQPQYQFPNQEQYSTQDDSFSHLIGSYGSTGCSCPDCCFETVLPIPKSLRAGYVIA